MSLRLWVLFHSTSLVTLWNPLLLEPELTKLRSGDMWDAESLRHRGGNFRWGRGLSLCFLLIGHQQPLTSRLPSVPGTPAQRCWSSVQPISSLLAFTTLHLMKQLSGLAQSEEATERIQENLQDLRAERTAGFLEKLEMKTFWDIPLFLPWFSWLPLFTHLSHTPPPI